MKKVLAFVLAALMVFSLVACGSNSAATGSSSAAAGGSSAAPAGDASGVKAAVFYYNYSDTYISSVRTALDGKLEAAGIEYTDFDGNNNQTTQNEQIDTALSSGYNLLIVNMVTSGSSDTATAIADKAKAAGVPVIFFNRAVEEDGNEGAVLGAYDNIAFVGTDAPEAGHMQGKMIWN